MIAIMRLDVCPLLPLYDSGDSCPGDTVVLRKAVDRDASGMLLPDQNYISRVELRSSNTLSTGAALGCSGPIAPFVVTVPIVIGLVAKKEMVGAGTRGIVTPVKHIHTVGDGAEVQHPRELVSASALTIRHEATVALIAIGRTDPLPAPAVMLDDVQPEFLNWTEPPHVTTGQESVPGLDWSAAATATESTGIIGLHRDLPLTRNRGASPGPVDAGCGASSCLNFTTPPSSRKGVV